MAPKPEFPSTVPNPNIIVETADSTLLQLRVIAEYLPPEHPRRATALGHIERLESIRSELLRGSAEETSNSS